MRKKGAIHLNNKKKQFLKNSNKSKIELVKKKSTESKNFDSKHKIIDFFRYKKPNRSFTKSINIKKNVFDCIRLNRFIAHAGICSRREADKLIQSGIVQVNSQLITSLGYKVSKDDIVKFDDKILKFEKPTYILLNKPKGYISTRKDEKMRKTVMDLVVDASPYRLFPVGRLDRSTTGLLLLSNDGEITNKLTHPSFKIKKIYHVNLNKNLSSEHFNLIKNEGIRLYEGIVKADSISFIEGKPNNEVGLEISIGWNRVVRRIFQKLGYTVVSLDRVCFAGLTKKNLKRGTWRTLNFQEINNLKML